MKKVLLLVLLILVIVACAPAPPAEELSDAQKAQEAETAVSEQVEQEAAAAAKKAAEEPETFDLGFDYEPYSQLGCENLLTAETFAKECNQTVEKLVVTYKIGTRNCYVSIKHREEERLTAGITLTAYGTSADAIEEFDRRLKVLKKGADKSVGERVYTWPKMQRETLVFLRGEYLVETGADERLCDLTGLKVVSRSVDEKLKQS